MLYEVLVYFTMEDEGKKHFFFKLNLLSETQEMTVPWEDVVDEACQ